jgi:hypothetical protein
MQIGGSLGQGLLCSIQTIETRTADPRAPDQVPRASHLGHLVLEWWIHWGRVYDKQVTLYKNISEAHQDIFTVPVLKQVVGLKHGSLRNSAMISVNAGRWTVDFALRTPGGKLRTVMVFSV